MRIKAENFGSYKELEFTFNSQRLTLISGPTGSGKSTLMDLVPWALFGATAKGGAVDEIRQWGATEPTTVSIDIDDMVITRTRGKTNDLYFKISGVLFRGKDLADTQKLINQQLGLTAESYLAAAYFHEFSETASFFTTTAKVRRQITEQLVDLSMAKSLTEKLSAYRKDLKEERDVLLKDVAIVNDRCTRLTQALTTEDSKRQSWYDRRDSKLLELRQKSDNFEFDKQTLIDIINKDYIKQTITFQSDIVELEGNIQPDGHYEKRKDAIHSKIKDLGETRCETCGALKNQDARMVLTKALYDLEREVDSNNQNRVQLTRLNQQLEKVVSTLAPKVNAEEVRTNTYAEQITELTAEINPHCAGLEDLRKELNVQQDKQFKGQSELGDFDIALDDTEVLASVTQDFRGACISNAVSFIETETNRLLTEHFDAELKVEFDVASADKLDITIHKDGNICTYSQLSKGQRQLLKLTFGVSVMKCVSNNSGFTPSAIFLDEPTDGCDENLKIKSFGLLEKLATEYNSVFVIDHNEALKSMFTKRYEVSLTDGISRIEEG